LIAERPPRIPAPLVFQVPIRDTRFSLASRSRSAGLSDDAIPSTTSRRSRQRIHIPPMAAKNLNAQSAVLLPARVRRGDARGRNRRGFSGSAQQSDSPPSPPRKRGREAN
jgi:hypothetical protein